MDRPARVHVLYLERAEDQRTADGKRSAGLHLEQTPGLGPYICTTCDAVADTWRNRCDNFQCALRMCCAEGALFRPSVAQFAVLSPRAALAYSLPAFGAWMAAQGTKRPTEALVVGAALRVAAGTLDPAACGVTHVPLACDSDGDGDAMWAWAAQWAGAVRTSAAGKVVTLLLEAGARTPALSLRLRVVLLLALVVVLALALTRTRTLAQTLTQPVAGAPPLVPSPIAGALAAHLGATAPPTDYILLVGGPSGVPAAWRPRVQRAIGTTLLKVGWMDRWIDG